MFSAKVLIICAVAAVAYGGPKKYKLSTKHLGVAGGVNATDGQFPFFASIRYCFNPDGTDCGHICGGVILNQEWILTAATCAVLAGKVRVGYLALNENSGTQQTVDVAKTFQHPDYDPSGLGLNEIGLVKLSTPLKYNINVQQATLPQQNQTLNGTADISGYSSFLPGQEVLQYAADRTIISYLDCSAAVSSLLPDIADQLHEDIHICTLDENANNCRGDSGNPLTQGDTVIGLTAWSITPCGVAGFPNVFTNVAQFADWVTQTIESN